MAGTAIRPQCNFILFSQKQETLPGPPIVSSFGSRLGIADINRRFFPNEPIILNVAQEKVDDMHRIKGHEFPTDPVGKDYVVMRNLDLPYSFDLSLESLGILAASVMGHEGAGAREAVVGFREWADRLTSRVAITAAGVVTFSVSIPTVLQGLMVGNAIRIGNVDYLLSAVDTVSNPPAADIAASMYSIIDPVSYVHRMHAADICTRDQYPSATWITGHTPRQESYIICPGAIVNDLNISVSDKGWIGLTGTAYSDGRIESLPMADAAVIDMLLAMRTEAAINFPIGPNIDFITTLGGMSGLSRQAKIRGFEFTINNSLDREDGHGNIAASGIYLGSMRVGDRAYTMNVTVEGHQGDEFWKEYRDDLVTSAEIRMPIVNNMGVVSSNRYAYLKIPVCTVDTITPGFDGIRSTLQIAYKPFFDSTIASPVELEIRNNVPEYNVM